MRLLTLPFARLPIYSFRFGPVKLRPHIAHTLRLKCRTRDGPVPGNLAPAPTLSQSREASESLDCPLRGGGPAAIYTRTVTLSRASSKKDPFRQRDVAHALETWRRPSTLPGASADLIPGTVYHRRWLRHTLPYVDREVKYPGKGRSQPFLLIQLAVEGRSTDHAPRQPSSTRNSRIRSRR